MLIETKGYVKPIEHQLEEHMCHDLSFRFTIKVKTWKGASQKCNSRVTFALLGV